MENPLSFAGARGHQVTTAVGTVEIVTRYDDYRPVAGMLFAHEVTLLVNGQERQRATFDRVEPNGPIADEAFVRPADAIAARL